MPLNEPPRPKNYKTPPVPPLSAALGLKQGDVDKLLRMASAALNNGQVDDASVWLDVAEELTPDRRELWLLRGMALARQKEFKEAVSAYLRALQVFPNDLETWTDVGEAYVSLGEYALAAQALKQAILLDPKAEHPSGRRARAVAGRTIAMLKKRT